MKQAHLWHASCNTAKVNDVQRIGAWDFSCTVSGFGQVFIVLIVTSLPLMPSNFGVNLGVRTWELLCFPHCFSRFYWLLCFTSLVSVTGSYPEDEPNFGRRFFGLRTDTEVARHTQEKNHSHQGSDNRKNR